MKSECSERTVKSIRKLDTAVVAAAAIGVSNAEAIIEMAVMRLGVKEEFYMAIPVNERDGGWAE